ncbi:MAG: Ig-like domain repeat protein [Candidatus Thermoplasmatota archaeon]|nr:Ig-like domain repeat protein [Candidatus Thermoplasmatota archaeon]
MVVAVLVASAFGIVGLVNAGGAAEQFDGYNKESGKWVNANLGKAYVEGDFVSYQLKLLSSSKIWGTDFNIKYNFFQSSSSAIYIDGFDTSEPTGFQYTYTGDTIPDGMELPPVGWGGIHIPTPEVGEAPSADANIINYMDAFPAGSSDGSPAGSAPSEHRYFTVSGLPWEDFTGGYVILFFRAHLALTIIWSNGLESDLPTELDGDEFQTWSAAWNGASAATGSSRHFYLEVPGVGAKTVPIPIAAYPSTIITGHKYVGDTAFDGWEIDLTGMLTLGSGLPDIPYNPPSIYTGMGSYPSGMPWPTGYFEFGGLVSGEYTLTEEDREGFGHVDIVVSGGATNIVLDIAAGTASFDLGSGMTANVDFYNNAATETTTLLSATTITLGQSVTDTATVSSSAGTPTGSVEFQVKTPTVDWTAFGSVKALVAGQAVSDAYTPLSTGQYYFRALYSGGGNFLPSQSGDEEEPLSVDKATPEVTTLLSSSSITLGESVTDTAYVTGLMAPFPMPTGDVQFQVKIGEGAWTDIGSLVPLVGGEATSGSYTPLSAGQYWFRAIYSGDLNYYGAQSGDEEEPLSVDKATPEVTTLLSDTEIELGESVYDTVTVTGLGGLFPVPSGTVQFQVKSDGGAWTDLGTPVTLVGGEAASDWYTPENAGQYWFRAIYSGDSNYYGAQSGEYDEPLNVAKLDPIVTTILSSDSIPLGESVTDMVIVTGPGGLDPVPTGTVQFQVKVGAGPWMDLGSPVVLVSGQATSDAYTPLSAGQYWFRAIYSGDANYNGGQSGAEEEPLSVDKATPGVTTLLSEREIVLGESVYDTVTVTGLGAPFPMPTGTVQFQVKIGEGAWMDLGAPVALVNGEATSDTYVPLTAGQYWFRAMYSGDANYYGAQSGDEEEPLCVDKATPTVTTLLSSDRIMLGESVTDTVTVTGLGGLYPVPTGTVQFQVKVGAGEWMDFGSPVALVNGEATSDPYTPASGGSYWFRAIYSGDANYYGAQSGDEEEPLSVEVPLESRTQGYWRNHPGAWVGISPSDVFPWTTGAVAGKTYMQILKMAPKGDATIILAHQYIAAVLNMNAFGVPSDVEDMIEHAEYLFSGDYPVGSNPLPTDPVRCEIINLASDLDDYNNMYDM